MNAHRRLSISTDHLTTILAAGLSLILLAACGPATGVLGTVPPSPSGPAPSVAQGSPDITPEPSSQPSTEPSGGAGSPAPSTNGGTSIVRAYFYLGGEPDLEPASPGSAGLVAVLRTVPATKAVATAAMNALIAGPTASESGDREITSAVPAGTQLLDLAISGNVATVDLSHEFEAGGGSASVITRLGQVVYTLTQFPTITSVKFEIDGKPVTVFGSEGVVIDGPVDRADYLDLLPAIWVDRPAWSAAIGNPAKVSGSANVFEATFRIAILDGAGRVLADEQSMATCGTGCRGTFSATVEYQVGKAQYGTLKVYAASAKDGSPIDVREYRVWLTPAA